MQDGAAIRPRMEKLFAAAVPELTLTPKVDPAELMIAGF
jgi:hypothetical protein